MTWLVQKHPSPCEEPLTLAHRTIDSLSVPRVLVLSQRYNWVHTNKVLQPVCWAFWFLYPENSELQSIILFKASTHGAPCFADVGEDGGRSVQD